MVNKELLLEHILKSDLTATEKRYLEKLIDSVKWISVKERLPKEETSELLFSADGKVYYGNFGYSKFYAIDSGGIFSGFTAYEVSHWMPLPEPPEMKGE